MIKLTLNLCLCYNNCKSQNINTIQNPYFIKYQTSRWLYKITQNFDLI